MPSPFPGMDPYLEDPRWWPGIHAAIIAQLQMALAPRLRPRYKVRIEERVYISDEDDPGRPTLIPDVRILEAGPRRRGSRRSPENGSEIAPSLTATTMTIEEVHETFLKISRIGDDRLVTWVELLSPTNKIGGSKGRQDYLEKRGEVMRSSANLVEIDLLRAGKRFAYPATFPPCDYLIHVSKESTRPKGSLWPFKLEEPMPVFGLALAAGDPDLPVDLRPILDAVYDLGTYDDDLDYNADPTPPLSKKQSAWADTMLRGKGLRGKKRAR